MSDNTAHYRRHDDDGIGRLLAEIRSVKAAVRDLQGGAPLRDAGISAREGRIVSPDFDGIDHDDLGTSGWSLGADSEGGASYLALNGLDVYETLQAQIDALPVSMAEADYQEGWQATNNGDIASVSFTRPPGKTQVAVMAQFSGWYFADESVPQSDRPAFVVRIGGVNSPPGPSLPMGMDSYGLVGNHVRQYSAGATVTVTVRTLTGPNLSSPWPQNRVSLGAMAIFT